MQVEYFGVRGSVPTPFTSDQLCERILSQLKPDATSITIRQLKNLAKRGGLGYGGNTSCVLLSHGNDQLIIDGGTGIRRLGQQLAKTPIHEPVHLLLTHLHWDHIQGLPFFIPLFQQGRKIFIYSSVAPDDVQKSFKAQWQRPYFPVSYDQIPSDLEFVHIKTKKKIGPFQVSSLRMTHPDPTFGYRVEAEGKSYAHFSDTELAMTKGVMAKKYQKFLKGVDLLTTDSQFDSFETELYKGWGHSSITAFIDLLHDAEVKSMALFHYNPQESEGKVDELFKEAKAHLKKNYSQCPTRLICAVEGQQHQL